MIAVILKTPFTQSMTYKQGIECAMNLADAEERVFVYLSESFLEVLNLSDEKNEAVVKLKKQLKQLELYEIPLYSALPFESLKECSCIESLLSDDCKVVVF